MRHEHLERRCFATVFRLLGLSVIVRRKASTGIYKTVLSGDPRRLRTVDKTKRLARAAMFAMVRVGSG